MFYQKPHHKAKAYYRLDAGKAATPYAILTPPVSNTASSSQAWIAHRPTNPPQIRIVTSSTLPRAVPARPHLPDPVPREDWDVVAAGRAFDLAISEDEALPLEQLLTNAALPGWVLADEQLLARDWLMSQEDEAWHL
jgi:hypothetical protein